MCYKLISIIAFSLRWVFAGFLLLVLAVLYMSLFILNSGILICFGKEDFYVEFHKKIENNIDLWEQKYSI